VRRLAARSNRNSLKCWRMDFCNASAGNSIVRLTCTDQGNVVDAGLGLCAALAGFVPPKVLGYRFLDSHFPPGLHAVLVTAKVFGTILHW